jgi:hypothetical protein
LGLHGKDKWGEYFADGEERGMILSLGKMATLQWFSNGNRYAQIFWRKRKGDQVIDVVRFLSAKDGTFIGQTKSQADPPFGFEVDWSLEAALASDEDVILHARDDKGVVIESVLLPKAALQNAARQLVMLAEKSAKKRIDYRKQCTAPQEIILIH